MSSYLYTHAHTGTYTGIPFMLLAFLLDRHLYILSVMSLIIIFGPIHMCMWKAKPNIKISFCDMLHLLCHTPSLLDTDRLFRHVLSTCCVPCTMQGFWDPRMIPAIREFPIWWTDIWVWFQYNKICAIFEECGRYGGLIHKIFLSALLRVRQCSRYSRYIKWTKESEILYPN